MSKISIAILNPLKNMKPASPEVQFLKKAARLSLEEAIICLEKGKTHTLYKAELFLNNHVVVDEEIRWILESLKNLNLEPYILKKMHDKEWDSEVDESVLINILDEAGGDFT